MSIRYLNICAGVTAAILAAFQFTEPVPRVDASQECDCSCDTFTQFRSRMQELDDAAESGGAVTMTPELQQAAACAGQCAMQWAQCGRETASDAPTDGMQAGDNGGSSAAEDETPSMSSTGDDEAYPLGEPRDDLDRFYGVYGDGGDSGRNFFVAAAARPEYAEQRIPPGYLMIGAMWGDVAPWHMESLSTTRFRQRWVNPGGEPVVAEFEVDGDGNATAITFQTVFDDRGRLPRLGDLPEGW